MDSSVQLPLSEFRAWARLNNITFDRAKLQEVGDGKGVGVLLDDCRQDHKRPSPVLRVSRDLILSAETVHEYAKVDKNFNELRESLGRQV